MCGQSLWLFLSISSIVFAWELSVFHRSVSSIALVWTVTGLSLIPSFRCLGVAASDCLSHTQSRLVPLRYPFLFSSFKNCLVFHVCVSLRVSAVSAEAKGGRSPWSYRPSCATQHVSLARIVYALNVGAVSPELTPFLFFLFLLETAHIVPGWPRTPYVVEDSLELLIFLPSPSKS